METRVDIKLLIIIIDHWGRTEEARGAHGGTDTRPDTIDLMSRRTGELFQPVAEG